MSENCEKHTSQVSRAKAEIFKIAYFFRQLEIQLCSIYMCVKQRKATHSDTDGSPYWLETEQQHHVGV